MKSGANKLDQNAIRKFADDEGKDASWISQKMQIPINCVEGFMPKQELSPQQRGAQTRKDNTAAALERAEEGVVPDTGISVGPTDRSRAA